MFRFPRKALLAAVSAAALVASAFVGLTDREAHAVTSQVTLTSASWTLLGSGPMVVWPQPGGSSDVKQIIYQSAATPPAAGSVIGIPLAIDAQNPLNFQGPVYARTLTNDGQVGTYTVGVALSGGSVASAPINISTAVTTQLVPAVASNIIYVNEYDLLSAGTTNVTFEYGTGALCATGLTTLTGALPLTTGANVTRNAGSQPVLVVPAGNALCVVNSAAIQISGSISYSQF